MVADLNERLNVSEDSLSRLVVNANYTEASLDALREQAQGLERTVKDIGDHIKTVKNSNIEGERGERKGQRVREGVQYA